MAEKDELKRLWDNNVYIGEIQKTEGAMLRVYMSVKDGNYKLNIREFYKKKSTNEWKPSLSGIIIPVEFNDLKVAEGFVDLIHKAVDEIPNIPMFDAMNCIYSKPKETTKK